MARAIPDDNLAYPVLITGSGDNTSSGFYMIVETGTYLVTAPCRPTAGNRHLTLARHDFDFLFTEPG